MPAKPSRSGWGERLRDLAVLVAAPSLLIFVLAAAGCGAGGDRSGAAANAPASEAARIIADYGGIYGDEKLARWLNGIGRSLAASADRPDVPFTFAVLDSPAVNAFSTPSGAVLVTRGLLALANSDADVAGVLGHEIGHVLDRDTAEAAPPTTLQARLLGIWARLAEPSGIVRRLAGPDRRFSQNQEFDADALAISLAAAAGYDPRALPQLLERLDKAGVAPTGQPAGQAFTGTFRDSHPLTMERVDRARRLADDRPGPRRIGRDSYLHAVDGMVFGASSNEGYVRNGVFIHPGAGLRFDVPAGYAIEAMPAAIVGMRPDGAAFVLSSAAPGAAATPYDYLTQAWIPGAMLSDAATFTVDGRAAVIARWQRRGEHGPDGIGVAVVGWSPLLVYRFVSIPADKVGESEADDILSRIVRSFRAVRQDELTQLRPLRIKVVKAKAGDNIPRQARRMADVSNFLPGTPDAEIRLLNGWSPGETIKPGDLFKTVE
jgi:predicted Zn-dependent protease